MSGWLARWLTGSLACWLARLLLSSLLVVVVVVVVVAAVVVVVVVVVVVARWLARSLAPGR